MREAYAGIDYYLNDSGAYVFGENIKGELIGNCLQLASDAIDALCYGRIRKIGFDNLTEFQQEKVKKAVCLHAKFLLTYGDLLNSPLSSYGINGVSMSFDASKVVTQGGVTTNQAVMQQLRQSGLATRLIP
ncbi:MAG: hypothetical protein IKY18_04140 [Oscillospiraceae bacterium]|nr:hypothetical protein [Oscillospiraceae bacterium]